MSRPVVVPVARSNTAAANDGVTGCPCSCSSPPLSFVSSVTQVNGLRVPFAFFPAFLPLGPMSPTPGGFIRAPSGNDRAGTEEEEGERGVRKVNKSPRMDSFALISAPGR